MNSEFKLTNAISLLEDKKGGSFLDRIFGKGLKGRMTVIGPANQIHTIEKDEFQIRTKVSVGD